MERRCDLRHALDRGVHHLHRRPAALLHHHQLLPLRRAEPGGVHRPAQLSLHAARRRAVLEVTLQHRLHGRRHPARHGARTWHRAAAQPQNPRRRRVAHALLPAQHRARCRLQHPVDLDFQSAKRTAQRTPRRHRHPGSALAAGRAHQQMGADPDGALGRGRRHDHLARRAQRDQPKLLRSRRN